MENERATDITVSGQADDFPIPQGAEIVDWDRKKIVEYAHKIIDTCVVGDMTQLSEYKDNLIKLNFTLDQIIYANKEIVKRYYNVIVFSFLSDLVYTYYKTEHSNKNFTQILNNTFNEKMIRLLQDRGAMNLNTLAKSMGITVQNASNHLQKLKQNKVVIHYKLPTNKRETYYMLSADCIKFLQNGKSVRKKWSRLYKRDEYADTYISFLKSEIGPIHKTADKTVPLLKKFAIKYCSD